jgi:hypothetical protein
MPRLTAYCRHKILEQCITIHCDESPGHDDDTKPFARTRMLGVGREKQVADPLTCTPPRKIRSQF